MEDVAALCVEHSCEQLPDLLLQGVNASMYVYQEVLEACDELVTADQYSSLGQVDMQTHLVEDATWAFRASRGMRLLCVTVSEEMLR